MSKIATEFKTFINRGSVLDLAIGVIIGAAFGKIVTSVINDIIMPPLGLILGNVNFTDLKIIIGGAADKPVTLNYGNFIQVVFEFLVIAIVIFMVIKGFNSMKKKEEAAPAAPPEPSATEKLLGEIRDLLKK
ncbi:MAG TPA: large-conductance mechanosensitive channel protein MscL [Bacteroidales bacterium]|nr:large-conductance mechanosensitive channel protein MscL [Bacteroidales bacterium]HSA44346.1 large-conductance mechanosensitive channel protein MscL [Bacteroidales bacterium]